MKLAVLLKSSRDGVTFPFESKFVFDILFDINNSGGYITDYNGSLHVINFLSIYLVHN